MNFTETLKKNYEFQRLYAKGKSAVTPYLVVYVRKTKRRENRVGFTVSNKLGKAVVRNRVRRRLREIYRLHESEFSRGVELVIVARARAVGARYAQLERALLSACKKLGVLEETGEGTKA
ncbi:MAG: ribonuclease P protein component [Deltaproteobacteria bacterium]|nr:ribonuclease P protein component [Deltaproteobacteria bacterium]